MVSVSVIGCGNMGSALIKGLSRAGGYDIVAADLDTAALAAVEQYCEKTTTDPSEATDSEVVFVVVKPDIVGAVLEDLDLSADQTLVSIAAGVSTDYVAARTDARVVRLMPNLAAETGTMAAAVVGADGEVPSVVFELLHDLGDYAVIDESLMDTATALNGSSPAFVFYLISAMRDAAVEEGMDEEAAETLAAQTFKGAAETVLRSDRSIEELIDAVCSPNGTTIEGMDVLRDSDVYDEVGAAVEAAARRSRELSAEVGDE
jgi:pyrroline-5-carboxylate reductase